MAGIGFELRKIYGRKTLASNVLGSLYATMTTIGPAVLSALLLLILEIFLGRAELSELENRFFIAAVTYAFLIAMLVSSPFGTAVSRYISDCIYLEKKSDICPSVFGVLALSTAAAGIVMLPLCAGIYFGPVETPLSFLTGYYFLGVLVADTYCMMVYASALKKYKELTLSFFLGMFLAVAIYFFCGRYLEVTKLSAACISLACYYFLIVFVLVFQCIKSFGVPRRNFFAFMPYFGKYLTLTISGCAYIAGLYLPTMLYWFLSDMSEQVSILHTCPSYDMAMFLATIVNMPALVIFVVRVETGFYEKWVLYVFMVNNASHQRIEKERGVMAGTLCNQLFFVYESQLIITAVLICLTIVVMPYLNVSVHSLNMFTLLSLGAYTVFCMYFTIVILYYFADYDGACIAAVVFLVVTALCSAAAIYVKSFYPLPLLIGGICGWTCAFLLLRKRVEKITSFLMC